MEVMGSTRALEKSFIHKHLTTCHSVLNDGYIVTFNAVEQERGT